MTTHLYLAPAATGKTEYLVYLVHQTAKDLQTIPRVCVPSALQAQAWRQRLAHTGGAIGVSIVTFDQLIRAYLNSQAVLYTELSDPVQHRLLRAVIDKTPLNHYHSLKTRPGFMRVLRRLINELKAAHIQAEDFTQALITLGNEARLTELARIYTHYQSQLEQQQWTDRAGLGHKALQLLAKQPHAAPRWPLLIVDGFDNFTTTQIKLLPHLAQQSEQLIITLTGSPAESRPRAAHHRFYKTRQYLESMLKVKAEVLPKQISNKRSNILTTLETSLFENNQPHRPPPANSQANLRLQDNLTLIESPDRVGEVRSALRWLKARLVIDGLQAGQVALLARSMAPYRAFITQTAAEFGLPLRPIDGLPLRSNPAIAALLNLLQLGRLVSNTAEPAFPRRLVIEAWRSPYFDWSVRPTEDRPETMLVTAKDAAALDAIARAGRVIGALKQWQEAFTTLIDSRPQLEPNSRQRYSPNLPTGQVAQILFNKFQHFAQRVTPPAGLHGYRHFVQWLEELIGADPHEQQLGHPAPLETNSVSLRMVECIRAAKQSIAGADIAALQSFKDVLRGLVWAEDMLNSETSINFAHFLQELEGAIEATTYRLPGAASDDESILLANVIQARGVSFRAVAVLGLAEGEFPITIQEDPFLRDADRHQLREKFQLPLESSTESAEREFFYETITRATEKLLLTRPRLTENGTEWQASPFWEEVRRQTNVVPQSLSSESSPTPENTASWPELIESLTTYPHHKTVWQWAEQQEPTRLAALSEAGRILKLRSQQTRGSLYDGYLVKLKPQLLARFGPHRPWSASRLESYRTCPFLFFVNRILHLEPRLEPSTGLEPWQLGNIYHNILDVLYKTASDTTNIEQLLAVLKEVIPPILDRAPQQQGFRETAWWQQTRSDITKNIQQTVTALTQLAGDFRPTHFEYFFSDIIIPGSGGDTFQLRGVVDRIDVAADGSLRLIDYKTSSPYGYTNKAVREGKKVQLPLYAVAIEQQLNSGSVVDGFYWHIQQAESSKFTLSQFEGGPKASDSEAGSLKASGSKASGPKASGPKAAMQVAVEKAWEAVHGVREGHFVPQPPAGGCPTYCPAATFCRHYQPGFGG